MSGSDPDKGRFDFRRVLGRGGTADVSLVWDARLNRLVALKQPRENSGEALQQFSCLVEREWHLVGSERFPGLVRLLDAQTGDTPYLVLEYCDGATLDTCRRGMPLLRSLNLLSSVALSLQFLHAAGIVHGDLKPQNVFLPRDLSVVDDGKLFWAKLSDLAFGRRLDEPENRRIGMGTIGYMAPEQIDGQPSSIQSDVFALGVMAYQLLSGEHPYLKGQSDPVVINAAVREDTPPSLSEIDPDIPGEVANLVAELMSREALSRPKSAWDVCLRLEQLGATYPFRLALQPGHFVRRSAHFRQAILSVPGLSDNRHEQFTTLAMNDIAALRMMLAANFARGKLTYDGSRFDLSARPYWPCRLRRKTILRFISAGMGRKRQLVKAAVIGDSDSAIALGILPDRQRETPLDPLLKLLRPLLKPRMIMAVSRSLARQAEHNQQLDHAARLWLQCGDLASAERCTHLAASQFQNEQRQQVALELLRRLRRAAQLTDSFFEIRQCLLLEGLIQHESGRLDDAQAAYDRVVASYKDREEDVILGKAYKCLGDLCKARQQFDEGVKILGKARELYERLGQDLELSHTLNNLGNIYWVAADYGKALDHYRQALRMQKRLDAGFEVASTLNNIGSIYVVGGRYSRAERIFNLSLRLKREIGHLGEMARTLNNLGYTYYLWGRQHKAVDALSESLDINRRIGSQKEVLFNLENLATLMIVAGQMKEALSRLKEGLALARELHDLPHEGVFNGLMSIVLRRTGRFDAALRCLDDVEHVLGQIDDSRLRIVERNNRAWCHFQMGDYENALSYNSEALELALSINDKGEQLQALMLRVRMAADDHNRHLAIGLTDELGLQREKLIMNLCLLDRWLRETDRPLQDIQPVAEDCIGHLDRMREDIEFAWMNIVVAEYHLRQNDVDAAVCCLDKARTASMSRGLLPESMSALLLTGKVQRAKGMFEEAFASYRNALDVARQMAGNISNERLRTSFMAKRTTRYLADEIKSMSAHLRQKERAGA